MPVLRKDPTTGDWVLFAPERGRRPHDRAAERATHGQAEARCPFCPGNEGDTPPQVLELGRGSARIRVVPNLFPAFGEARVTRPDPPEATDLFEEAPAHGAHEVVIESDRHDGRFAAFDPEHVVRIFEVYRRRYRDLRDRAGVHSIVIFRNYRPEAGMSLSHPHSQIVAVPQPTPEGARRLEAARRHHCTRGTSLYCDLRDAERRARSRILFEEGSAVALQPYFARHPFETWILPLGDSPSFAAASATEVRDVAIATRRALAALAEVLDDPPYNFVLHTPPVSEEERPWLLWHVQIIPRLYPPAGLELGTGLFINTWLPEDAAEQIRSTLGVAG